MRHRLAISILLAATVASVPAAAQDLVVMRRPIAVPRPKAAPTPAPAPTVTCGSYATYTWDGSDYPPSVVYDIGRIADITSARAQCEAKAKTVGKPGICLHYDGPTGETYFVEGGKLLTSTGNYIVKHTGSVCTLK